MDILVTLFVLWTTVLTRIHADTDNSCGGYQVNQRHTICCNGLLYIRSGFRQACCGSVGYDAHHYLCCGTTIIHKGSSKQARCCGDTPYDAHVKRCKDGYLEDRTGIGSTCCQTYTGWKCCPRGGGCCSAQDRDLPSSGSNNALDVPGFRPACCGRGSVSETAECCRNAIEKTWVVPPCCDADDALPVCCVKPDGDWECCTPQEGYCCGRDSVRVQPGRGDRPGRVGQITTHRPEDRRTPEPWRPDDSATPRPWIPVAPRTPSPWGPVEPRTQYPRLPQTMRTQSPRRQLARITEATTPYPTLAATTIGPSSTCCSSVTPHPSCCRSLRRRPQCCFNVYRYSCCVSSIRLPYCCQSTSQNNIFQPGQNHPQRQRPSNRCCTGPARPTCCYSWYYRSSCCDKPNVGELKPVSSQEEAPYEGQVASCCSSSNKQQCCEYGKRVTGESPICCNGIEVEVHTTLPTTSDESSWSSSDDDEDESNTSDESSWSSSDDDKDESNSVVLVEERDPPAISHSCCGVDESEITRCCANGFRRTGIQPECCGRKLNRKPSNRGDIPADHNYVYFADDPGDVMAGSCCNKTEEEKDICCREGYLNTGQTLSCCRLKLHAEDSRELRRKKEAESHSRSHTCCGMSPTENWHCCQKPQNGGSIARCCRSDGVKSVTQEPVSCCDMTHPTSRIRCCQNGLRQHNQLPTCCANYQTTHGRRQYLPSSPLSHNYYQHQQRYTVHQYGTRRRNYTRDICGSRFYDTRTHMCCSGIIRVKRGLSPKCCATRSYDAAFYRCCPGNRLARSCGVPRHLYRPHAFRAVVV